MKKDRGRGRGEGMIMKGSSGGFLYLRTLGNRTQTKTPLGSIREGTRRKDVGRDTEGRWTGGT